MCVVLKYRWMCHNFKKRSTKKKLKGYAEKHKIIILESSQSNRLVELYTFVFLQEQC